MAVDLEPALAWPFDGLDDDAVGPIGTVTRGKVRDIVELDGEIALVATDRLSAFDRVLGTVPFRGQVLTELSAWWFDRLDDIVASHVVAVPDPNLTIGRRCTPLPVEVVVRGHLSGSTSTALWTQYEAGQRCIYGIDFADGMRKNDSLARPIITPTTKARAGGHDSPISESDIVSDGLVDAARWEEVRSVALAMFERGAALAADAGLVLVDTKYEFGVDDDSRLVLIDEVHTPDSSRFWRTETLEARLSKEEEPDNLDKEVVRLAYAARGYRGEGRPEPLDVELATLAATVYLEAFERLTGSELVPAAYPAAPRVAAALRAWSQRAREDGSGTAEGSGSRG